VTLAEELADVAGIAVDDADIEAPPLVKEDEEAEGDAIPLEDGLALTLTLAEELKDVAGLGLALPVPEILAEGEEEDTEEGDIDDVPLAVPAQLIDDVPLVEEVALALPVAIEDTVVVADGPPAVGLAVPLVDGDTEPLRVPLGEAGAEQNVAPIDEYVPAPHGVHGTTPVEE